MFLFLQGGRPELEIIGKTPTSVAPKAPILFVHGAYTGAWCWEEHFLPYFADHGHPAYAVSLRGHGNSQGHESLPFARLGDYVCDLRRAVESIDGDPILVGHSMGGMAIQKYLEKYPAPAVVLMSAPPPSGLMPSAFRLAWTQPELYFQLNLMQVGGRHLATIDAMRRLLFRPDTPQHEILRFAARLQEESFCAVLDMSFLDLPYRPARNATPVQVLGGERDALFSPEMFQSTARAHGTEANIIPGMPHAVMLDREWRQAAERTLVWLNDLRSG